MSDLTERLRHVAWLAEEGSEVVDLAAAAAERISTLEALTDQLAEALDLLYDYSPDLIGGDMNAALRAYEADKEAHR